MIKTTANEKEMKLITASFIFDGMDKSDIGDAMAISNLYFREYEQNEKIFDGESFERAIAIILSGGASVYRASSCKKTLLNTLRVGDSFGASSLFDKSSAFSTSIYAKSKCKIAFISQSDMESLFKKFPQISINYIKFLSRKIRFLNDKIDSFAARSAEEKTAKFLLLNSDGNKLNSALSMTKISSSLGIGRASFYRVLASLEAIGAIKRTDTEILICDKEKLKNILKEKETKK